MRFYLFFIALFFSSYSEGQTWLWANKAGGTLNDESRSVTTDPSGNVIITGAFRNSALFIGGTRLLNHSTTGTSDVLVIKYNSAGTVLWAISMGGSSNDVGRSVSCDAAGNIYVTGYFRSAIFKWAIDSLYNTSTSLADAFVAKISPVGNVIWVRKLGGRSNEFGNGIKTDLIGNSYFTGNFTSDTLLVNGNDTLFNTTAGTSDMFVVKIDAVGNFIWGKKLGGNGNEIGQNITLKLPNKLIVTGYFNSDSIHLDSAAYANAAAGFDDIIVLEADTNSTPLWVKTFGGSNDDRAYGITNDQSGRIYLAGRFGSPTISFDSYSLNNFTPSFTADIFLARLDNINGQTNWAIRFGGTLDDLADGVSTDVNGNVYAIGRFSSNQLTLGATVLSNYTTGTSDIFMSVFDSTGVHQWSVQAGKSANDYGQSVATFNTSVYLTGFYRDTSILFGSFNLVNALSGNQDIFVAAIGPPTPLPIQLLSFSGKRNSNSVNLEWSTSSEVNNDHFLLERSLDGITYESLGKVKASGNSNYYRQYGFIDYETPQEDLYYKLSQYDFDGRSEIFDPIVVQLKPRNKFEILNIVNPTMNGQLTLEIEAQELNDISFSIVDKTGRNCFKSKREIATGISIQLFDISNLEQGVYFMKIFKDTVFFNFKIVVIND